MIEERIAEIIRDSIKSEIPESELQKATDEIALFILDENYKLMDALSSDVSQKQKSIYTGVNDDNRN